MRFNLKQQLLSMLPTDLNFQMKWDTFRDNLKLRGANCDMVIIRDLESTSQSKLLFKNALLNQFSLVNESD